MLTRVLYFVLYIAVACLIGWAITTLVDWAPFIPGAIKSVLNVLVWGLIIIGIIYYAIRVLVPMLPGPP